MSPSGRRGDGAGSFEEQMAELLRLFDTWLRPRLAWVGPTVVLVAAVLWAASGIYVVDPGHVGVERTFGKEGAHTGPGLRYHLPWPVQQVDVVSVEKVHRIEIGLRRGERVPEEALMLTGDENIVEAHMVVLYKVADPAKYLFRLRHPEMALHAATQVALRSAVGKMTIDDVMIENRARVEQETRDFVRRLMKDYLSGLEVSEVKLQVADAPDAVKDAFHDVVRAREDKERVINMARGYQADVMPRARGAAQQILREAEAYKEQRVFRAQGDGARYLSVLAEYQKAKPVTRDRLHLEMVEKVLPDIDKVVVDGKVGERLMPLLPMGAGAIAPAPPAAAQAAPVAAQAAPPPATEPVGRPLP